MQPSTHALRVLLAAFKDRGVITVTELEQIPVEAACSARAFRLARAELAKAGTIRRSRDGSGNEAGTGAVTWGIVPGPAPKWTGPDTSGIPSHGGDSLGVPC